MFPSRSDRRSPRPSLCSRLVFWRRKRAKSARRRRVLHLSRVKCASSIQLPQSIPHPKNDISDHCIATYHPSNTLVKSPTRKCCKTSPSAKHQARVRTAARIVLEEQPTTTVTRNTWALALTTLDATNVSLDTQHLRTFHKLLRCICHANNSASSTPIYNGIHIHSPRPSL